MVDRRGCNEKWKRFELVYESLNCDELNGCHVCVLSRVCAMQSRELLTFKKVWELFKGAGSARTIAFVDRKWQQNQIVVQLNELVSLVA